MGYHPETLAFSFPPYPRGGTLVRQPDGTFREKRSFANRLYRLRPWIGFDIWHIDPEHSREGQRTDDSCGWFDRTPGPYQKAVDDLLKDVTDMHDIKLTLARRKHVPMPFYEGISSPRSDADVAPGYPRLSQADTLAVVLNVATRLERLRWWEGHHPASWLRRLFMRERNVLPISISLSLNATDNLSSVEDPGALVRLVAGALHREFRPWWKHPRWHVHHWQIKVDLFRNLKRMVQPCATCGKRLGFGYCPSNPGDGSHHHAECLGLGRAKTVS